IIVVGVFGDKPSVNMGYVQDHELSLLGSAMYVEQDFLKAIELIDKELIELDTLITHRFDFKDYMEAYNIIDNDKDNTMKVIIEIESCINAVAMINYILVMAERKNICLYRHWEG